VQALAGGEGDDRNRAWPSIACTSLSGNARTATDPKPLPEIVEADAPQSGGLERGVEVAAQRPAVEVLAGVGGEDEVAVGGEWSRRVRWSSGPMRSGTSGTDRTLPDSASSSVFAAWLHARRTWRR
jgi:hypothetical protein